MPDLLDLIIVSLYREYQAKGYRKPKLEALMYATGLSKTYVRRRVQTLLSAKLIKAPAKRKPRTHRPAEQMRWRAAKLRRLAVQARSAEA